MTTPPETEMFTASPAAVWNAFVDFHNVHTRVVPGVVVASKPEGDRVRIVTFANGLTVREELISADPEARRLAYTASGGALSHHNGVFKIRSYGEGCRVTWIIDFLPDAAYLESAPA